MEKILFDVNVLKIQINKHGDTIDIDLRDRSQVNSILKVFDEFMSKYQVLVNSNSEENIFPVQYLHLYPFILPLNFDWL